MLDSLCVACDSPKSDSREGMMRLALPETLAVIADYGSLIEAIERRRVALGLSQIELDDRAGLAAGHYSHIAAWRSAQGRNLGPTTFARVLAALGLKLAIIADTAPERGSRDARMARSAA